MSNLTVFLPLTFDFTSPGKFKSITKYLELIDQNLRNIIFTNPGERVMLLDFGVGIKKFLFEPNTEITNNQLKAKIMQQVKRYMPYIEIDDVLIRSVENKIFVTIRYLIIPLQEVGILDLSLLRED